MPITVVGTNSLMLPKIPVTCLYPTKVKFVTHVPQMSHQTPVSTHLQSGRHFSALTFKPLAAQQNC